MGRWNGRTSKGMITVAQDVHKRPLGPSMSLPDHGLKVVVKNTFLDLEAAPDDSSSRRARSCMARFVDETCVEIPRIAKDFLSDEQETASSAGTGLEDGDTWEDDESAVSDEVAQLFPSLGSRLHNTTAADGLPLCQPCAWFHKAAGCQNGLQCSFCHLCPKDEMKNRRKQKQMRLRAQEAEKRVLLLEESI